MTDIHTLLDRGTVDVIVRKDLEAKLKSGKKLRVKLGIDPTKPDIHLGHSVPLRKLKQFQDAGHQVILLFGGFTATIGDPTGKNEARPPLTLEEVEENAQQYLKQAGKILDIEKTEVRNNREWLEHMKPQDFIKLMGQFTVGQMMERDMFQVRKEKGLPIFCHEILYPMLQGYDSVALEADLELGGTDQLFNLLAARPLQKAAGQVEQNVLTVPLIEGLDGVEKMSKSLGNYIGMDDAPNDMFGKIMSVPDKLMKKYFEVLTDEDMNEVESMIKDNPRNAKIHLGKVIVEFYHSKEDADAAEQHFINTFVKHQIPEDIPEFKVSGDQTDIITILTTVTGFAKSSSEARRLVTGGGVSYEGEKITDPKAEITIDGEGVLKVGKRRFARLKN